MKLARFSHDGLAEIGIVTNGIVAISKHLPGAPTGMIELIDKWDEFEDKLNAISRHAPDFALDAVRLLAPIARPSKIFGIGLNYADHIAESKMERPKDQTWFSMPPTAANGPFEIIALPRVSVQLDYEAELVVVIGKRCRYADPLAAADAIFGYCVGNDVSVRDWQFRTSQFILGLRGNFCSRVR